MTIIFSHAFIRQMWTHAKQSLPEECCGVLLGEIKEMRYVRKVIRANNVARKSRETRFAIDPLEYIEIDKKAESAEFNIIGIYHSHPNGRAEPSKFDQEVAWPSYSYVILSLLRDRPFKIVSGVLNDDRSGFNSEELVIL